ncbi:MAG: DNA translocase FtsK 4TM domain-containing protein, partial [Planctomycetes bacterium]|nr:DNA translocase FtsK 4TM domain-containing protein [Planctomycetota bacterium]
MPEPKKPSNRIRELIGIFLLVIAFIVFISLVTWNQADYPDQVHPSNAVMANKAGALGAAVSKELFWLFGSISYVMAAMLALWGDILLFRTKVSALVIKIVSLVLFMGTSLIFFGLITPADFKSVRMESFGGVLGHSAANLMTDYFGSVGAYPVTLFVLLGSLLLATDWLLWDFIL